MERPASRQATEIRQASLVAAAIELARHRSPAAITTGELARAVGLSQGAVFKHFPTKESIWVATMDWVHTQLMSALEAAATGAPTALAGLRAVFDAHVAFVMAHPGVPRIIFHELHQPDDSPLKQRVRQLMQDYRSLLLQLLAAGAASGELARDLDTPAAATQFVGLIQGLVMQAMLAGQISTMGAQAPHVFNLYLRGVRHSP